MPSGKLELKIPWKKLTKDPLVVSIDDVYVVLEPDLDMHYDPEKALKRQRKEKEKKIKDYEEAAKKKKLKESEWWLGGWEGGREGRRERGKEREQWHLKLFFNWVQAIEGDCIDECIKLTEACIADSNIINSVTV